MYSLSQALLSAVKLALPCEPWLPLPHGPGRGGLLWRCLGGSHTLEPDFRWRNKQQEQQMRVRRNKAALLMQMSPVVTGNVREGNIGVPMADRDAALFLIN